MKKGLVVLAAGMGSRYGGLKQLDTFGPNGEAIIDYSVYDAVQAGFTDIILIIREQFRNDFERIFNDRFGKKINVHYVSQELGNIPKGYTVPDHRQKPWGTAHAVDMASKIVDYPFAVINADDYYGKEAFHTISQYFDTNTNPLQYALVGYKLENTLSDHGTVNRGVCSKNDKDHLTHIEECVKIQRESDGIIRYPQGAETKHSLPDDAIVSMNMFGFYPNYFQYFEEKFSEFLDKRAQEEKSEFYIPTLLDSLMDEEKIHVKVLSSDADWFGVTYKEDKPIVINRLNKLIANGSYPTKLWN